jgi:hypothetical protein
MGTRPAIDQGITFPCLKIETWDIRPDGCGTGTARGAYILVIEVLRVDVMAKFLLFCILLVLCWPLALLAVIAYPFVWLLLLPFRIVGIAVGGALELVSAIIFLPVRMIRAI